MAAVLIGAFANFMCINSLKVKLANKVIPPAPSEPMIVDQLHDFFSTIRWNVLFVGINKQDIRKATPRILWDHNLEKYICNVDLYPDLRIYFYKGKEVPIVGKVQVGEEWELGKPEYFINGFEHLGDFREGKTLSFDIGASAGEKLAYNGNISLRMIA